ncbi:NAD(P)-binding Rossmann-fold containing protein [Apiospora marii]|uniref:NAD(P)-binding Rossmann-fold containing protein n=1 Tax=Apiospora marii TaxID=335849 RepID=A0ABR1S3V8_9PEZI
MGTVIITGANGSLATPAAEFLLQEHPDMTAIFTVRDPSDSDANTVHLRQILARYPNVKTAIHALDLGNLAAVQRFADDIARGITDAQCPPLRAIVCNAFYWNLVGGPDFTDDGYEKTFQVNHVAHASLVLRLLGHFGPGGRVVLFSSDAHWPGKNSLEKIPPEIPSDLERLVKPPLDPADKHAALCFQRYANSKLAITSWAHSLNRHLLDVRLRAPSHPPNSQSMLVVVLILSWLPQDPALSHITAVAINPGNLSDSRALRTNTPGALKVAQRLVIQPFMPILRLLSDSTMRTSRPAGEDVMKLALGIAHPGERGFFTHLRKEASSPGSLDEGKQEELWAKTLDWTKVTAGSTAMKF